MPRSYSVERSLLDSQGRVLFEPGCKCFGGTVGQQLDRTMLLVIHNDRSVALAAQQGEVIHADHLRHRMGGKRGASDVA